MVQEEKLPEEEVTKDANGTDRPYYNEDHDLHLGKALVSCSTEREHYILEMQFQLEVAGILLYLQGGAFTHTAIKLA